MRRGRRIAQGKLIQTNKKFGNRGEKYQQGTTRIIYDSIQVDTLISTGVSQSFTFFRGVNSRAFPLTNLDQNRFDVMESMVIQRIYFMLVEAPESAVQAPARAIDSISNIEDFGQGAQGLNGATFDFYITNNRVIKDLPLYSFSPDFNKNAMQEGGVVYTLDTAIVIPPQMEFRAELRVPPTNDQTQTSDVFLLMALEGPAAIFAPKGTY